jgi:hypothetical protein
MAPTAKNIFSHASNLNQNTTRNPFKRIFETASKKIASKAKRTINGPFSPELSKIDSFCKRLLKTANRSTLTSHSLNGGNNLTNDTPNRSIFTSISSQKRINFKERMGRDFITAIIILVVLAVFAIIWEIYRRHGARNELPTQQIEEVQRGEEIQ